MFHLVKSVRIFIMAMISLASIPSSSTLSAFAPMSAEVEEGFDRQTPEEIEAARQIIERDFANAVEPHTLRSAQKAAILASYGHLDPSRVVPSDLLQQAVLYFDANKTRFANREYITIIDFKKRSNLQRFYLINMRTGKVERFRTTHGLNSDKDKNGYAESFGNVVNSGKSSLGFIRTAEVYHGKFKRSIRLDGLQSTNSNIRARAIVFHGWDNIKEENRIPGLSWGCPAVDWKVKDGILDKIKEGSLMYMAVSKK